MPFLRYLTASRPHAFLLPFLLLFGSPAVLPAQDLTKLTVAYSSRSIAPIDYFIGAKYGFFKAEGLDVRLVQIRANVAVIATLASEVDVLASITTAISAAQRGAPIKVLAVTLHQPLKAQPKAIRALMKAQAKANRQFHENPQVPIDVIAKVLQVDKDTARETYLLSKRGFTQNGMVSEKDAREYLKGDAERQKLKEPLPVSRLFDFSLQEEINGELGIR